MSEPAKSQPGAMPEMFIRHRSVMVVSAHTALFSLALLAAFLLAYNFRFVTQRAGSAYVWFDDLYLPLLALALPIKLLVFYLAGQYRGSWRYIGLRDLFGVITASLVGTFFFLTAYFLLENGWHRTFGHALIDDWPAQNLRQLAVFVLDWASTIAFVSASRIVVRFYYEDLQSGKAVNPRRMLICGAGDAGEAVLRELLRVGRHQCVGFLDDRAPLHSRIHEVEIIGRTTDIRELCERHDVEEVLIAMPGASPRFIRGLVEKCHGTGVLFRTMPVVTDVIEGRVQVSQIRDVDIDDLLGREEVRLDADRIGNQLKGRRVAVTGAGGSIGSQMCRQIAAFAPGRLILIERAENNLFEIDRELRASFPEVDVVPFVADVTDRRRIDALLRRQNPSVVFHAAAHKHVPMMEGNPGEAVKNNIAGSRAVADACVAAGVQKMVMISTDKAVNPTSIMGCTKRVAEMYVQGLNARGATQFVTVRFGNVLGSSGSVVPIFKKQIEAGGPVTVTHPDMTRYFMTIPEAAQLVLQAGTMGRGGEIYVLHMGEPVKILDLARDMIALSGLRPEVDVDIVFTGIRPGEKLFEELSNEGEDVGETSHPKIGIWKHRTENFDAVVATIERLCALADEVDPETIRSQLKELVPEFQPTWEHAVRSAASSVPPPTGVKLADRVRTASTSDQSAPQ